MGDSVSPAPAVPANRPALREGDSFSSLGAGQTSEHMNSIVTVMVLKGLLMEILVLVQSVFQAVDLYIHEYMCGNAHVCMHTSGHA